MCCGVMLLLLIIYVYIYIYTYIGANHFNKKIHTANDLRCCILNGHFKSNKERQICEKKLIVKYNCHIDGFNKDKSFYYNYRTLSCI